VRLACVDDDTLIRDGVSQLIPGVHVVGAYARVELLLETAPRVDVVLLDLSISLPITDAAEPTGITGVIQGARAVREVVAAGYDVLIYTNERRREVLAGCLAAGARGVVHKSEELSVLAEGVRSVAAGHVVVTTALVGLAELGARRGHFTGLSPRQIDVLRGRARGESFKSIAGRLFISPRTAEEYMAEVTLRFADYLSTHSPADLERRLGIAIGDLLGPTS
jgi:DNA-binding NarL/FixJ family response regulator